ncbi:MAG TPA: CNNM domain-containing protein [Gemmatimonadaceae bacterium]
MTVPTWPLVVAVVIVAILTAGAIAVRSVSRIWLRHWAERRMRGAETAVAYLERPQRMLGAASAGVSLTVALAGMLLGAGHHANHTRFAIALLGYAIVMLLLGQIVPRVIGRRWAVQLTPVLLPFLRAMELVAAPLLDVGRRVSSRVRPSVPGEPPEEAERDAIQDLLREGELEGVGEAGEIAIITGVVEFGEKVAADVMTPREEVFWLDVTLPARELAERIASAGYSRVPLGRGSMDAIEGMVHVLDVLQEGGDALPPLRPVAQVLPDALCSELLFRMLRARLHLAIVRDAQGTTLGLLTLEDLLEELVGDIQDEYDEPTEPSPPPS